MKNTNKNQHSIINILTKFQFSATHITSVQREEQVCASALALAVLFVHRQICYCMNLKICCHNATRAICFESTTPYLDVHQLKQLLWFSALLYHLYYQATPNRHKWLFSIIRL